MADSFVGRLRGLLRQTGAIALLFPLLLAAGCQTAPPRETAVLAAPVPAEASLPTAAARYIVEPDASEVRVLVYRAGPLARFGHNHVVIGRAQGEIRIGDTAAQSGFRLEVPVETLAVDPPAARAEEGEDFAAEVSGPARRATRDNMLGGDVLDAARHPTIRIASIALAGPAWNPTVMARVTLRGATRDLRFPAAVFQSGDALAVIASFRIRQTEFGIEPFAALNGGLRTGDALDIRIRILARRER
jgi:polyisoprenoid-binding protein YceI